MAKLMAAVFGGKKKRPTHLVVPKTVAQMKAAFNAVFNPGAKR
jgi:hypothetical protein